VLFTRTTDLVQRLQVARQNLSLETTIEKLDKYHLIDRLTDRAHIITTGADSYRFRRTAAQRKAAKS
jgi:hypothetical protein